MIITGKFNSANENNSNPIFSFCDYITLLLNLRVIIYFYFAAHEALQFPQIISKDFGSSADLFCFSTGKVFSL